MYFLILFITFSTSQNIPIPATHFATGLNSGFSNCNETIYAMCQNNETLCNKNYSECLCLYELAKCYKKSGCWDDSRQNIIEKRCEELNCQNCIWKKGSDSVTTSNLIINLFVIVSVLIICGLIVYYFMRVYDCSPRLI